MSPFARFTQVVAALLLLACADVARSASAQQVIELQPGWNAVFVQLEPEQTDIRTVFAGLPIASVWRWRPDADGAQFVQDPAEGLENLAGWFAWFPEPRPEAFLTNLFQIEGSTAYLVKLEGTQTRQITITGRPIHRPVAWQANAFTLTGLPIDPQAAPSFGEFFASSTAHANQPVYKLHADGQWQLVTSPASETIEPGRAYWVYSRGNSLYQGPMQVLLEQGETLEYSGALQEMRIVLRNFSQANGSFQIERVDGDTLPLLYKNEDPETGEIAWPALRDTLVLDAPRDADVYLTLAIDRPNFSAARMDQVISISDEQGTRVLLYAGGNTIQPLVMRKGMTAKGAAGNYAGLWIGSIAVNKVSEAQQAGTTPTATTREFVQRVLMHVDNAGQVRLLKDVIQMWEDGTLVPSAVNPQFNEVDEPGRFVLITDKNLIGLYKGATNRAGASVGIRYSTVAYDFEGDFLEFDGGFGPDQTLQLSLVVEPDLPTNPFLHRYHPDHNNLDEQFLNYQEEAYRVVRDMQFVFTDTDPLGRASSGWGDSRLGGRFEEAIVGLHRNPIFVSGRFELRRVSAVPVLNQ